ncbi:helicase SNF2 [Variovorax sp. N23]|uniref:helicase SNF2 n=1 Tax=Variovorax sp. N23 TaxID=2980555 RepID=UPI0021C8ED0C|nr:helicase SNF2 [Variovorax sp. N23]MCU4119503.1 helicase SNF2 [Variovorax sp. N23]
MAAPIKRTAPPDTGSKFIQTFEGIIMKTPQLKTSQFLGAVVLSILGVASGAQAETYQGVQTVNSTVSRADVASQARVAARAGDQFSEASYGGVAPVTDSGLSRAAVRAQASQAARQGDIYSDAAMYGFPAPTVGQADRATVRAEAREAARNTTAMPL